jgi:3-dehydroquinate synthase
MMSTETVLVKATPSYPVIIGPGALKQVDSLITEKVNQIAVIYPKDLKEKLAELSKELSKTNKKIVLIEVDNAENAKNYQTTIDCWNKLGENNFTRSDLIIGFGGGATTDLAGFIAATWLRGVEVILIPTSLLAMVDAAVGGKTGINTPAGKNLVGVFASPIAVICDLDFLLGLPKADLAAGMAEVVKCGFISDLSILKIIKEEFSIDNKIDLNLLQILIKKAVATKAAVVADDFKETADGDLGREILNYGHTLGHAIEKLENFSWRHGDAVAVGMVFAAELAHLNGQLSEQAVATHRELISKLGLPVTYSGASFDEVIKVMAIDKKTRGNTLRFVVLSDLGKPTRLVAPSEDLLRKTWNKVSDK